MPIEYGCLPHKEEKLRRAVRERKRKTPVRVAPEALRGVAAGPVRHFWRNAIMKREDYWDHIVTGVPDRDDKRRPKSRRPGIGETLELMPLEASVGWYYTHFLRRRTRPCLGSRCFCQKEDSPVESRWVGWILAFDVKAKKDILAALTDNCYKSCSVLQLPDVDLRGCKLTLKRHGKAANGKVTAEVEIDAFPKYKDIRLPYTQRDQLMRVWFSPRDSYAEVCEYGDVEAKPDPLVKPGDRDQVDEESEGAA
jgi:hypothetical protein